MQIDPFFQVPQRSVNTSMGAVEVPVLYKEGDYSIALFCTLRERVEALLAGTSFVPAMTFGRYAIVGLVMANGDPLQCHTLQHRLPGGAGIQA